MVSTNSEEARSENLEAGLDSLEHAGKKRPMHAQSRVANRPILPIFVDFIRQQVLVLRQKRRFVHDGLRDGRESLKIKLRFVTRRQ